MTAFAAMGLLISPIMGFAQTQVTAPKNRYSINDDIQLGRQAAAEVEQKMQVVRDREVQEYISAVGYRLVAAIPPQFQHPEFRYTFQVVNARDLNAFALPGGPMFVNSGMIVAAHNEGELAGVMAHELSHVVLRHATAQATETQKYQVGSVLGQIAGAVIGGGVGSVIGQGSQIGFGLQTLKYSRAYETQADVLGSQIMARAGYDPRDLANVFRTIESQGSSGGPQFLSSHPNPGNRYARIQQEAAMLRVSSNVSNQDSQAFREIQARLTGNYRGTRGTYNDTARNDPYNSRSGDNGRYDDNGQYGNNGRYGDQYPRADRVAFPSTRYRTFNNSNLFQVSVPDNWQQVGGEQNAVTFAPAGAFGTVQGSSVFTHGVQLGVSSATERTLRTSSDVFVNSLLQSNNYLRQSSGFMQTSLAGRSALVTTLTGRSPVSGQMEIVNIYTTQLRDGSLFYAISVAPQSEISSYQNAFQNVMRSIRLNY